MSRHRRLALAMVTLLAVPALAQGRPQLEVSLPGRQLGVTDGPIVSASQMLADGKTRELLHSGFPVALHYRVELWRKAGWPTFNERQALTEWDMLVEFDPVRRHYHIRRVHHQQLEDFGTFPTLADAEAMLSRPYRPALGPRRSGEFYYDVALEVRTLSGSDLDALQRWLRGEAEPAVRGRNNPASALQQGIGTLMSRVLGGATRRYERRSGSFTAE